MHRPPAFRVLRSVGELDEVEAAWDGLDSSSGSPTQTAAWLGSATAAFPQWSLHAVVLGGDRPTAAAPLVSRFGFYETSSVRQLYEPVDFLWATRTDLDALAEALARARLPVVLGRVPGDSPTIPALRAAYGRRALILEEARSGLPLIELDETWREPESHLNAGRRSDLRRARRRAEEGGPLEVDLLSPGPNELPNLLAEVLAVEARSWKGQAGTALVDDPVRLPFYRSFAERAALQGALRIALLRIDGRPVAMQLAVERARAFWLLKIAFDEAHARASPGQLLMLEVVRLLALRRLESVQFLGSSAPWVRLWTSTERRTRAVSFLPPRPGSVPPAAEEATRRLGRPARRLARRAINLRGPRSDDRAGARSAAGGRAATEPP